VVSGGQGLTGLQERARLVGGMVHAGPAADGGFRIAGVLPYGPRSPRASESGGWPAEPGPDGATFVDAANDFRGQSEGAIPGDGGADIDWSGAPDRQKEFDIAMGRKKKGLVIGCGAALLAFLVLGVLAVVLIVNLVEKESDRVMLDPSVYKSVKVGDSETAVRAKLPHGKSFLAPALDDNAPAAPRGSDLRVVPLDGGLAGEGRRHTRLPLLLQGRQTDREAVLHVLVIVIVMNTSWTWAVRGSHEPSPS
jgi:hypothetical protein